MLIFSFRFLPALSLKRHLQSKTNSCDMALKLISSAKCFEGEQRFYTHYSDTLKCQMDFGVYLPPQITIKKGKCPVLYFLNGLTATHENFMQKSGFHKYAASAGLCVVSPDTSPRNIKFPKHDVLGPSAGFYMDATEEPWSKHFKMFTYVTKELIEIINSNLPVIENRQSISGFSMGGYGALICSLKNPRLYQSVSALAPVCNPMMGGLGKIALEGYIGQDTEKWKSWDPCCLAANYCDTPMEIFIDQGSCDEYDTPENDHLFSKNFIEASNENDLLKTVFKKREGYNHSHYYIATFVEEHIEYHAKHLYDIKC